MDVILSLRQDPIPPKQYDFTPNDTKIKEEPKMKKRLFGLALALCVALVLLPTAAFAEGTAAEQLTVGETYYFDLSSIEIPNSNSDLHYVPFTYVGTINAYKLDTERNTNGSESGYDHSLFFAETSLTKTSWNDLKNAGLIYGTNYSFGGVAYTLRAPSGGGIGVDYATDKGGSPTNNEYDVIRAAGLIKCNVRIWAQDLTPSRMGSAMLRTTRDKLYFNAVSPERECNYAPVLEVPDGVEDTLRVVTVDTKSEKGIIRLIVKENSSYTAPSVDGLTPPDGLTKDAFFCWMGSDGKWYDPEKSVPAEVTSLTAIWDGDAPNIIGLENNATYCGEKTFTVTDNIGVTKVTVNGTVIQPENGTYTLTPAEGEQTIEASDAAGNAFELTVTVNSDHTYDWQSENGQYWQKCKFCNAETEKKTIPALTVDAPDVVCRTQDTKFSFALPEGCKTAEAGYEFPSMGSDVDLTEEDGVYSGVIETSCYEDDVTEFKLMVSCYTADGYFVSASKTIIIQNEHSGGKADCHTRAICTVCGESYGEFDAANHTGGTEVRGAKAATCTADGYTGDTYCKGCGVKLESGTVIKAAGHTGGKADCHTKAVCAVCGESYGEFDAANHTGGTEVRGAKAATCTADGYTGDTYCKGCGAKLESGAVLPQRHPMLTKVEEQAATAEQTGTKAHWHCATCNGDFADAAGTQKLTAAELTIPKLTVEKKDDKKAEAGKDEAKKASPKTADTAVPVLALAAMALAGAGLAVTKRKEK